MSKNIHQDQVPGGENASSIFTMLIIQKAAWCTKKVTTSPKLIHLQQTGLHFKSKKGLLFFLKKTFLFREQCSFLQRHWYYSRLVSTTTKFKSKRITPVDIYFILRHQAAYRLHGTGLHWTLVKQHLRHKGSERTWKRPAHKATCPLAGQLLHSVHSNHERKLFRKKKLY